MKALACGAILFLLGVFGALLPAYSQTIGFERDRARAMLDAIKGDIKKHYYDSNFRGIDVDARFAKSDEAIKAATSVSQIVTIIAQTLLDFQDSHTFFIPPQRQFQVKHGWQ
ncbi:MAG TPA: hypothetical protein VEQ40_04515, partial [Pyrinomonadaceae bacterium]|nr:hypothetical protein [Pyrinomonadaceae bacterium]